MANGTVSYQESKELEESILLKVKIMIQENSRPMEQAIAKLADDMQTMALPIAKLAEDMQTIKALLSAKFSVLMEAEAPTDEDEKQKLKEDDDVISEVKSSVSMEAEADIDFSETETVAFRAENNQLSFSTFYSRKEIFARELISNASDSLDEIRSGSLTNKSKRDKQPEIFINLIPDKINKALPIIDSIFGMTKAGLVENLGAIARSETKEFMEVMQGGADDNTIG